MRRQFEEEEDMEEEQEQEGVRRAVGSDAGELKAMLRRCAPMYAM